MMRQVDGEKFILGTELVELKKGLKQPGARVGLCWKWCRKQPPAVFCHLFTNAETYGGKLLSDF
jgi:hypothetical protein